MNGTIQTGQTLTTFTFRSNNSGLFLIWCNVTDSTPIEVKSNIANCTVVPILVTIINPKLPSYNANSSIPVEITARDGVIMLIWFNCKNSSEWIYPSNITYIVKTSITVSTVGNYVFYAWANNTDGDSDVQTFSFTVVTPPPPWIPPTVDLGAFPAFLANALSISVFAGGILASLIFLVVLLLLCVIVVGKLGGGNGAITITTIIIGLSTIAFCTAVQWIAPWVTVFISLGTALGIGYYLSKTAHSSEG